MTDWSELKRLAESCAIELCADEEERDRNLNEFYCAVEPEDVAALIAENERLKSRSDELSKGGRVALELLEDVEAERDRLKAELERVRVDAERLIEKWRAHAKRLRKDKQPNVSDMADDCADELGGTLSKEGNTEDGVIVNGVYLSPYARLVLGNSGGAENALKTVETREIDGVEGGTEKGGGV